MTKAIVNANSKSGIALRKNPYFPFEDDIIMYLKNGITVTTFENIVTTDPFGDSVYIKVRLESGKEGYVIREALEAV